MSDSMPASLVKTLVVRPARSALRDLLLDRVLPSIYEKAASQTDIDPRKVLFVDDKALEMPGAFSLIYTHLQESYDLDVRFIGLGHYAGRSRQAYINACLDLAREMADASIVFLADASDVVSCLPLRPQTRVVQLWHACGAFKKWGYSTADLAFGDSRSVIDRHPYYKNLSLVTVSSPEVEWAYREAMGLEDTPEIVKALGTSRTDVFFDDEFLNGARAAVEKAVPAARNRKVMLYAPTFRGHVRTAVAPNLLDIDELRRSLGNEWTLLVKNHPFVKKPAAIPEDCRDFAFDVSAGLTIEQLLAAADALVTDYSSVIFEYSLLDRPMAFFAPDIEEYADWRGFYYSLEELAAGPILRSTPALVDWARGLADGFDLAGVRSFRERFMAACDGRSTERICAEAFRGRDLAPKPEDSMARVIASYREEFPTAASDSDRLCALFEHDVCGLIATIAAEEDVAMARRHTELLVEAAGPYYTVGAARFLPTDRRELLDAFFTDEGVQTPLISVIVPVYNKDGCLEACVKSLMGQTAPAGTFEVVLVDDGSSDGSLEICRSLAKKYPCVRVLAQGNRGVSGARNTGIAAARGKYLMFLDADDSILNTTINRLARVFERFGDATDVVAYRIEYFYPATGKVRYHDREQWMSRTGLYPLDEYPFLAQSTMNVCVRNRGAENILFDERIKMGEDQLFVTRNLERTGVLGYCAEARYRYVRSGGGASSLRNNPYYAFEDMMALYGYLVRLAQSNPKMERYAYHLVAYNLDWRLRSSILFPTDEADEERLAEIVRAIPCGELVASPYLDEHHKAMLLKRYVLGEDKPVVSYGKSHVEVTLPDGSLWQTDLPTLIMERCHLRGRRLEMRGHLTCPAFIFEDKPEMKIGIGSYSASIDLGPSSYDRYKSRYETTRAWSFEIATELTGAEVARIGVTVSVNGAEVPGISIKLNPEAHNGRLAWNRIFFEGYTVVAKGRFIEILRGKPLGMSLHLAARTARDPRIAAMRAGVRLYAMRNAYRRTWLYSDLPTSPSEGNALWQMLRDLEQDDGIERYYVSNFPEQIIARHPEMEGRIVGCRTHEHAYLALCSELVLTSYIERFTYLPIGKATYNSLGDIASDPQRIYLQHGILHAHMPWYFSYDRIPFDYEVISTAFEQDNLIENYGFPEDALILSGAPRLDAIDEAHREARKIIFAPSWRAYLVAGTANQREGAEGAFEASSFFKGIMGFLRLVSESGLLERNDYELELKLHPNFDCYRHMFEFESDRIRLAGSIIDEADYSLVITDFSSYVYDFVFAGARVIYFVPDRAELDAGLNHYSKLDRPLEEGFGPYCETPEEAFEALKAYLEGTVPAEDEELWQRRAEGLFLHSDGENADRLHVEAQRIANERVKQREIAAAAAPIVRQFDAEERAMLLYRRLVEHARLDDSLVLIESQQGRSPDGNMFYVLREFVENPRLSHLHPVYVAAWGRKDEFSAALACRGLEGVEIIERGSREYLKALATAKYLATDNGFPPYYVKVAGQVVWNTWHGTPLKTLGRTQLTESNRITNMQRNLVLADYLSSPNVYTAQVLEDGYMFGCLSSGATLISGYPRNVAFFADSSPVKERFDLVGRRSYAYLPTFRSPAAGHDPEARSRQIMGLLKEVDELLSDDETLFVNLHAAESGSVDYSLLAHVELVPRDVEIYAFLNACDALATDYSSVMFDFALTRRKVVLLADENDGYQEERGLLFGLDELPFPRVSDAAGLVEGFRVPRDYDDATFLERFGPYDGPKAATLLCERVFLGEHADAAARVSESASERKAVLAFVGTIDEEDLMAEIGRMQASYSPEDYEIYLTFRDYTWDKRVDLLKSMPEGVSYFPYQRDWTLTVPEQLACRAFEGREAARGRLDQLLANACRFERARRYGFTEFAAIETIGNLNDGEARLAGWMRKE